MNNDEAKKKAIRYIKKYFNEFIEENDAEVKILATLLVKSCQHKKKSLLQITDELFTDGYNRIANRLVMEFEDKTIDGTGWSKLGVLSVLERNLNK